MAVLVPALGIGINAAILSAFAHVLLAPLRFPDPGNLYVVSSHASSLAVLACLLRGSRASQVDPRVALNTE
jgi:hypothetical protein